MQELGIDVTDLRSVLPDFRYRAMMDDGTVENEVCPVYTAVCAEPSALSLDATEVASAMWVDWVEFRSDVLAGRRVVSPWCARQLLELPPVPG